MNLNCIQHMLEWHKDPFLATSLWSNSDDQRFPFAIAARWMTKQTNCTNSWLGSSAHCWNGFWPVQSHDFLLDQRSLCDFTGTIFVYSVRTLSSLQLTETKHTTTYTFCDRRVVECWVVTQKSPQSDTAIGFSHALVVKKDTSF